MKLSEYLKGIYEKSLEKGKTKLENIQNIAKEFIDHTAGVTKEVAEEALEFLEPYSDVLGRLWDQVKETLNNIIERED